MGGAGGFTVAGSGGRNMGGNPGGGRGGAGNCDKGCTVDDDDVCEGMAVTWVCDGNHDQELFKENCVELSSSGRLRYCCPPDFPTSSKSASSAPNGAPAIN
jgi:hypothetical protein